MSDLRESLEREVRKKASSKFNSLFSNPKSVIPDLSVVEQASSDITAGFVASLVRPDSVVADLTAGLGINTIFFSSIAGKVYAVEKEKSRSEALLHNLEVLGIENVEVVNEDCIRWLTESIEREYNFVYIDPARRTASGRRHAAIEDYSPNIEEILKILQNRKVRIIIKVSPLVDLHQTLKKFPFLSGFYLVEVNNEMKEILLDISFGATTTSGSPFVKCIIFKGEVYTEYEFKMESGSSEPEGCILEDNEELKAGAYIFEPSPAIMKSGRFNELARQFKGLRKISRNTHLFYSESVCSNFPGKVFRIKEFLGSGALKKLKGERYNVISRNHPAKAEEIQKRFKLRPSEDDFLLAFSTSRSKHIVSAQRLSETDISNLLRGI